MTNGQVNTSTFLSSTEGWPREGAPAAASSAYGRAPEKPGRAEGGGGDSFGPVQTGGLFEGLSNSSSGSSIADYYGYTTSNKTFVLQYLLDMGAIGGTPAAYVPELEWLALYHESCDPHPFCPFHPI